MCNQLWLNHIIQLIYYNPLFSLLSLFYHYYHYSHFAVEKVVHIQL